MLIRQCIASKPGLLQKELSFDDKCTVIYGGNESGKSLIAKAMMDTLWGGLSENSFLNRDVWEDFYMEVVLANSASHYRFIKNGQKYFKVKACNGFTEGFSPELDIFETHLEERNEDTRHMFLKSLKTSGCSEVIDLFNKIDLDIFLNIAFLPSPVESASSIKFDYNALMELFLQDSSGYYSLFSHIKKTLNREQNDELDDILNKIFNCERKIKDIEKQKQIFEMKDLRITRLQKERERVYDETRDLKDELFENKLRKTILLRIVEQYKKIEKLSLDKAELKRKIEAEKEKINLAHNLAAEIKKQFPQFSNFNETNINNLNRIEEAYREVRDAYEAIEDFHLRSKEKKKRFQKAILGINVFSIILAVTFYIVNKYAFPLPAIVDYNLFFFGGILIFSSVISIILSIYILVSAGSKELSGLLGKKVDIKRKLKSILDENNISLQEYKLEVVYEFLVQYFEEYGEYSMKISDLLKMQKSLKDGEFIKHIEEDLRTLEKEEEAIKDEINMDAVQAGLDGETLTIENINILINEINQKINPSIEKIKDNENIILQVKAEIEESHDLREEINALSNEKKKEESVLKGLNAYKSSLLFIMELFQEAIEKRKEKITGKLIQSANDKFQYITNKQYTDSVNNEIIRDLLTGRLEDKVLKPPVVHLLLLSIKIAITFLLFDFHINLPLIIDEPFQHMDDARINRFREIINEISRSRQVIIFTHNKNYADWGGYIEL